MMKAVLLTLCFLVSSLSFAAPSSDATSNILIYDGGTVQVTSEINAYDNIVAGVPIKGSVLITHDENQLIDQNSFNMDGKPLPVKFFQTVTMSAYSKLVLSIYHFQLDGMTAGAHTLAPIKVKVGGKEYQALPLTVDVSPS